MAQKMPLILSTLTIIAGSLTSTMATWADSTAYSEEGPWTFNELIVAEAEVQETINQECPYSWYPSDCSHQHVYGAIAPSPIFAKLGNFEASQFYITSLNPTKADKNTIEAYYRSENTFEKYDSKVLADYDYQTGQLISKTFDDATYFHKITKLHILQVEKGHEPWSIMSDMEAGATPYWRVLYSASKSDDADSLFPADQKITLDIDAYSFDPKYDDKIIFSYEDETGRRETFYNEMRDCHQGGEICKMYFLNSPTEPLPYLINNPTYEEGYIDGYAAGQNDGREEGYIDGHTTGQNEGYNTGHSDGYDSGYAAGQSEGYENGYASGYESGHSDGKNEGYDDGYQNGFTEGLAAGQQSVQIQDNDSEATTDGPELDSNQETVNDAPELTDNNNIVVSSEININTAKGEDCTKNKLASTKPKFASTPNTGAPNKQQESVTVEFPWWLGAIILIGFTSLAWLFWPNRKKSSKKS